MKRPSLFTIYIVIGIIVVISIVITIIVGVSKKADDFSSLEMEETK